MDFMLNHLATIRRNAVVGTNGRRAIQDLYTGVSCLALPMNNTAAIENHFEVGRAYDVYFADGQDVKPGDKIVVNGLTIVVSVVQPFTGLAFVSHVRCLGEQEVA